MIKLFVFVRRKPGLAPAEFGKAWRDMHAPLVGGDPGLAGCARRYVQSHAIPGARVPELEFSDFDCMDSLWIRYWIEVHGPTAHGVPEFTRYYGRYVHNYALPRDPLTGSAPDYDGIVEEWLESADDMARCLAEPGYLEICAPTSSGSSTSPART